jgi:hypothetical protein
MKNLYVPMSQRTPAQIDAYRASCRERNRRYYWRKKRKEEAAKRAPACEHPYCTEKIMLCGFCAAGMCEHG